MSKLPRITEISHTRPGWSRLRFESGAEREIEWRRYAEPGTVMERLADPAFAKRCRLIHHGYAIAWPGDVDWSAGAALKAGRAVKAGERKAVGGPLFGKRTARPGAGRQNGSAPHGLPATRRAPSVADRK